MPDGYEHYKCNHLHPHEGDLSNSDKEVEWRRWFESVGWLREGYCFLYYPQWIREVWEDTIWKTRSIDHA
jgi:hypothetical protein